MSFVFKDFGGFSFGWGFQKNAFGPAKRPFPGLFVDKTDLKTRFQGRGYPHEGFEGEKGKRRFEGGVMHSPAKGVFQARKRAP